MLPRRPPPDMRKRLVGNDFRSEALWKAFPGAFAELSILSEPSQSLSQNVALTNRDDCKQGRL